MTIDALMRSNPVIPVLVLGDPREAEAIARAFVAGGLTSLEVTLRTPHTSGTIDTGTDPSASAAGSASRRQSPAQERPLAHSRRWMP